MTGIMCATMEFCQRCGADLSFAYLADGFDGVHIEGETMLCPDCAARTIEELVDRIEEFGKSNDCWARMAIEMDEVQHVEYQLGKKAAYEYLTNVIDEILADVNSLIDLPNEVDRLRKGPDK